MAIAQLEIHPKTPCTIALQIAPPKQIPERSSNNGSVAGPAIVKIFEDLAKRIESYEKIIAANDKKVETFNSRVDHIPRAPPIFNGVDSRKYVQ